MREFSANTPPPPYDVIIFTGKLKANDDEFAQKSIELYTLMQEEEGFLGSEVLKNENNFVTVHYYWQDLNLIRIWDEINAFMNEKEAEEMKWFEHYKMRIGRIEREFEVNNEARN